ncbi:hypothetical protein ACFL35_02700 [Candidatus Riflebacteria bacterium]
MEENQDLKKIGRINEKIKKIHNAQFQLQTELTGHQARLFFIKELLKIFKNEKNTDLDTVLKKAKLGDKKLFSDEETGCIKKTGRVVQEKVDYLEKLEKENEEETQSCLKKIQATNIGLENLHALQSDILGFDLNNSDHIRAKEFLKISKDLLK